MGSSPRTPIPVRLSGPGSQNAGQARTPIPPQPSGASPRTPIAAQQQGQQQQGQRPRPAGAPAAPGVNSNTARPGGFSGPRPGGNSGGNFMGPRPPRPPRPPRSTGGAPLQMSYSGRQYPPSPPNGPQILTDRIRADELRLVDEEGNNRLVSRPEAEAMARETELDLLIVSMASNPPVVRLVDYGKYRFESDKKARETKKRQHVTEVKEVKLSIRIDTHDYDVKMNRAIAFLKEGHKVKTTIRLKGREMQHPELAHQLAKDILASLAEVGTVESPFRMDGRQGVLFFSPSKETMKALSDSHKTDAAKAQAKAPDAEKLAEEKATSSKQAAKKLKSAPLDDLLQDIP